MEPPITRRPPNRRSHLSASPLIPVKASEEDVFASATPEAPPGGPAELPVDPVADPVSVTGLAVVVVEAVVLLVVVELVGTLVGVVDDGVDVDVDVDEVDAVSVASQQAVLSLGATSIGMSAVGVDVSVRAATSIDVGLPMHEAGNAIENRMSANEALGVHGSTWLFAPRIRVASSPVPALANWATKSSFVGSEFPLTQIPQFTKKEDDAAVGSTGSAVWSVSVI